MIDERTGNHLPDLVDVERVIRLAHQAFEIMARETGAVDVKKQPELVEAVRQAARWPKELWEGSLGLSVDELSRILKGSGMIKRKELTSAVDHFRSSLLRAKHAVETRQAESRLSRGASKTLIVHSEGWVAVRATSEIKLKISSIALLLDEIISHAKHTNLPQSEQCITEIEREQLIAILETAIRLLQSPLVEKGLLKKAKTVLSKGATNAAEKSTEQGLGKLMEVAGEKISEIIDLLF